MNDSSQHKETLPTDRASATEAGSNPHQVFAIGAATSLVESEPLVLKYGDAFGVFDKNGDISVGHANAEGLYYKDTRHLSTLSVTLHGARPILLSSTLRDDNATMTCDLSNPDLYDREGHLRLEHDRIHVRRSRFLWDAACFERLSVCNFDDQPHRLMLEINFSADFADLFEVRGIRRALELDAHVSELAGEIPSPIDIPAGCRLRARCPLAQPVCAQPVPYREVAPGHFAACHLV